MTPLVTGVRDSFQFSKRDLLLFDHLCTINLRLGLRVAPPGLAADLNFLKDRGFLTEAYVFSELLRTREEIGVDIEEDDIGWYDVLAENGQTLVPLISNDRGATVWRKVRYRADLFGKGVWEEFSNRLTLVEVVIPALTVPGEDVPLTDVLDFGQDDTTIAHRTRLYNVLHRASLAGTDGEEFGLQLAEAIADYEDHMKLADLHQHNAITTILLGVAGAVEELIRARPSRAVEALLSFQKAKAERLQAEILAPGRGFAFIYDVDKKFGQR